MTDTPTPDVCICDPYRKADVGEDNRCPVHGKPAPAVFTGGCTCSPMRAADGQHDAGCPAEPVGAFCLPGGARSAVRVGDDCLVDKAMRQAQAAQRAGELGREAVGHLADEIARLRAALAGRDAEIVRLRDCIPHLTQSTHGYKPGACSACALIEEALSEIKAADAATGGGG